MPENPTLGNKVSPAQTSSTQLLDLPCGPLGRGAGCPISWRRRKSQALKGSCLSQPFLASDPKIHRNKEDPGSEPQHQLGRRGREQAVLSQLSLGWPAGQVPAAVLTGVSPGSLDSGISGYKSQRTLVLSVGERTEPSESASLVGTDSGLGVAVRESGVDETAPCLPERHAWYL